MAPNLRQHEGVKYSKGLTSFQIWQVMNELLYEAAAPLCAMGNMSVETVLSCLNISTNYRRMISAEEPDHLMEAFFVELCRDTAYTEESRLELLNLLLQKGVERNIIVDHIVYALQTSTFPHVSRPKLYAHVGLYLEQYEEFKRDVVFRYYHYIESFANRNYHAKKNRGLRSSKGDMFHVYVISSMRAIDRFIPFKGTLTKNIQNWFKNAEGSSDFITYDNEAVSLNRSVRKQIQDGSLSLNNKAIPVHDRENTLAQTEDETLDQSFAEYSRSLANLPNSTIVFLAQNLPYTLSAKQCAEIEKHNHRVLTE